MSRLTSCSPHARHHCGASRQPLQLGCAEVEGSLSASPATWHPCACHRGRLMQVAEGVEHSLNCSHPGQHKHHRRASARAGEKIRSPPSLFPRIPPRVTAPCSPHTKKPTPLASRTSPATSLDCCLLHSPTHQSTNRHEQDQQKNSPQTTLKGPPPRWTARRGPRRC